MRNSVSILLLFLMASCASDTGKNQVNRSESTMVQNDSHDQSSISNEKHITKPKNCTDILESIDYSGFCLSKNDLKFHEHFNATKSCAIDLSSSKLNGGELDVNFYYEDDPNEMEHFKLVTRIHKTAYPGSSAQTIEGLGHESFIVSNAMEDIKIVVVRINNVRIMIHAQIFKKKIHCMYSNDNLIGFARAIASKIK